MSESSIFQPMLFRLYSFMLSHLRDWDFRWVFLRENIEACVEGRSHPHELLKRPLARGLPYLLGQWAFEYYLSYDVNEKDTDPFEVQLMLEDLYDAADRCGFVDEEIQFVIGTYLDVCDHVFINDGKDKYAELVWMRARECFCYYCDALRENYGSMVSGMCDVYAQEVADRIIHDRQLCAYVSQLIVEFDFGKDLGNNRKQWIERVKWPSFVRGVLYSRDRGKCAICGNDLVGELRAKVHIDHIIPLALGGINDIANLQLACESCNVKKQAKSVGAKTSVPQYLLRRSGVRFPNGNGG